jgi:hypothetical protein
MKLQDLKNKKIVFFAAETIPSTSGSGINVFRFAEFLSQFSKSVKIICFNYNNKFKSYEQVKGVRIKRIKYFNQSQIAKILSFPFLIYSYIKEPISHDISLIYGSYMPGFEIIFLVSKLFKRKTIFQATLLNDDDIDTIIERTAFPFKTFRKYLYSKVSLFYAINNKFEKKWKNNFKYSPASVLASPGVNISVFKPLSKLDRNKIREKLRISNERFVIFSCGTLIERKGYRHIFMELSKLEFPFIIIVAGQNTYNPYRRSTKQELFEMETLTKLGIEKLGDKIRIL